MRKSVRKKLAQVERELKEYSSAAAQEAAEAFEQGEPSVPGAAVRDLRAVLLSSCAELIRLADYNGEIEKHRDELKQLMESQIERYIIRSRLRSGSGREADAFDVERSVEGLTGGGDHLSDINTRRIVFGGNPPLNYLLKNLRYGVSQEAGRTTRLVRKAGSIAGFDARALMLANINEPERRLSTIAFEVGRGFTRERIIGCMLDDERLREAAEGYIRLSERGSRVKAGLLDAIPSTYPELFPLARQMKRHFILHIGPTNSGKSHDAIEALKTAESGIYLAPLRLLAFEKFEELNEAGCPCTLKTGEEEIGIPFSYLQSSTIEVLDFSQRYDVAVIDEAQMVADRQRGSAWTFAILGVQAEAVHVCLAPEAEKVVISMIEACGDSYTVVRHKRLVPLSFEFDPPVHFPGKVERGTAFIVFSRRDVHAAAAELQRNGYNCSVIYGALPYDVRRNEVKRYVRGETDIVVATDAIGMGLNLPIKRIYFLAAEKFDGVEQRPLRAAEIKQIAGRAGRFGMFDRGLVSADSQRRMFAAAIGSTVPQIKGARIGFPYSLIGIEGPLSQLMTKWCEIEAKPGFEVADLSREIDLAQELERLTDDKDLVYSFVMIPFDEKTPELKELWLRLFDEELSGRERSFMNWLPHTPYMEMPLDELELSFKVCDLLYHYAEKFVPETPEDQHYILMRKNEISSVIMDKLASEPLRVKTCKLCGRPLPFSYKFGLCDRCFRRQRRR